MPDASVMIFSIYNTNHGLAVFATYLDLFQAGIENINTSLADNSIIICFWICE